MSLFRFLGVLSPAGMIATRFLSRAKRVGTDLYGNKYFIAKARKGYKRERRFVIYKGAPEATMIPPEWHGWMHHQSDELPSPDEKSFRRKWQKAPQRNLTGTQSAYSPEGHMLKGGQRQKTTGDYEAWSPPE